MQEAVTLTVPVQHSEDTIKYCGVSPCQMGKSLNYLIIKAAPIYIINPNWENSFGEVMLLRTRTKIKNESNGL